MAIGDSLNFRAVHYIANIKNTPFSKKFRNLPRWILTGKFTIVEQVISHWALLHLGNYDTWAIASLTQSKKTVKKKKVSNI